MKRKINAAIAAAEELVKDIAVVKSGLAEVGVTSVTDVKYEMADDAELSAKWSLERLKDLDAAVPSS